MGSISKACRDILERDNSFSKDIAYKRSSFIAKIHSIPQEFHFANPIVKMNIVSKYATSFYGSSLWSIFDGSCDKLFTAWNNAIRDIFELPRGTHRYFIEDISDHLHPLVMISSRFIKFHQSLQDNPKPSVKFLSNISSLNNRTSYCQNLKGIARKCKEEAVNLTPQLIKRKMKYCEVEPQIKWKT